MLRTEEEGQVQVKAAVLRFWVRLPAVAVSTFCSREMFQPRPAGLNSGKAIPDVQD